MTAIRPFHFSVLATLVLLLLGACSTGVQSPVPDTTVTAPDGLESLQKLSRTSNSPQKEVYQLRLAEALLEANRKEEALSELRSITAIRLPENDFYTYSTLLGRLLREQGDLVSAFDAVELPKRMPFKQKPTSHTLERWQLERILTFLSLGRYLEAAQEASLRNDHLAQSTEITQNNELLWEAIRQLPSTDYSRLTNDPLTTEAFKDWLELSALSLDLGGPLERQAQEIRNWLQAHPTHSAALFTPVSIQALLNYSANQPKRIALLLPLSGSLASAGDALLEGFMAARYEMFAQGLNAPDVQVFDTSSASMMTIYQSLLEQNCDFIIGPLDKTQLAELLSLPNFRTPILGLNSLPANHPPSTLAMGFSLAIEHEAAQVALKALEMGHQNALIVTPQGTLGNRAFASMTQTWQKNGGNIVSSMQIPEDNQLASALEQTLLVDASSQRRTALQNVIGRTVKFTPRRRQDLDVILLASSPRQARQFKPMLAFYFADTLPIYGLSSIYSGTPNPILNRDLDDVTFLIPPWLLHSNSPIINTIERNKNLSGDLLKLAAMGVDSYFIQERFQQLKQSPYYTYNGILGKLRLDENDNLHREQSWAVFNEGIVKPVID